MNWFCNASSLHPEIKIPSDEAAQEHLSDEQATRLSFYRAICRLTRLIGGTVDIATIPDRAEPVAISCWWPPYVRNSQLDNIRAGMIGLAWRLGAVGTYRLLQFLSMAESGQTISAASVGCRHEDGAFVDILGSDPAYAGRGYATALLEWQIDRHRKQYPGVLVFLDTSTSRAQRNYERLGFRETNRKRMDLALNHQGLPLTRAFTAEEQSQSADWHVFRHMVLDMK